MITYFARKLLGGLLTCFLVTLVCFTLSVVCFTLSVEIPGGAREPRQQKNPPRPEALLDKLQHIDKQWPSNYFDWLLDNEAPDMERIWTETTPATREIAWQEYSQVAGVLTGNLGYTVEIEGGTPVSEMYGTAGG